MKAVYLSGVSLVTMKNRYPRLYVDERVTSSKRKLGDKIRFIVEHK